MKVWVVYEVTMCPELFGFEEGVQDASTIVGVYTSEAEAHKVQDDMFKSRGRAVTLMNTNHELYDEFYPQDIIVEECDLI